MNLYIYKRVSTTRQADDGLGLEIQSNNNTIQALCKKYGLTQVIELATGVGLSGYHGAHIAEGEALRVFIDNCKEGKIPQGSILYVYSLDRLSRLIGLRSVSEVYSPIVLNGVRIFTQTEQTLFDDNDMSQLMATLLFQRAHNESLTKSQRNRGSTLLKIEKFLKTGKPSPNLTRSPFWIDNTSCEFNEWRLAIDHMVGQRLKGVGYKTLCVELQELFPRKPLRKDGKNHSYWTTALISKTMRNIPMLQGHKKVNISTDVKKEGEKEYTLENYYPSVITPTQALKLTALASTKSRELPPCREAGLLKLRCGVCSYPLLTTVKNSQVHYYCASGMKGESRCSRNYVSSDFIDKWVLLTLTGLIHLQVDSDSDDKLNTLKLKLSTLENELTELVKRYKKNKSVITLDLIDDTENEIKSVKESISNVQKSTIKQIPNVKKVSYLYHHFDSKREEIRDLFLGLVDKVELHRVGLEWNLKVTVSDMWLNTRIDLSNVDLKRLTGIPRPDVSLSNDTLQGKMPLNAFGVCIFAIFGLIVDGYLFDVIKVRGFHRGFARCRDYETRLIKTLQRFEKDKGFYKSS